MDILQYLWVVVVYGLKFTALLAPPCLLFLALVKWTGLERRYLSVGGGLAFGALLFFVGNLLRRGVPMDNFLFNGKAVPVHLVAPYKTVEFENSARTVNFLDPQQFWQHEYFSFWSKVVNPFVFPWGQTVAVFWRIPHFNGVVILGLCGVALAIGMLIERGGPIKSALAFWIAAALAFYIGCIIAWVGAVIGVVVGLVLTVAILGGAGSLPLVRVVR